MSVIKGIYRVPYVLCINLWELLPQLTPGEVFFTFIVQITVLRDCKASFVVFNIIKIHYSSTNIFKKMPCTQVLSTI